MNHMIFVMVAINQYFNKIIKFYLIMNLIKGKTLAPL